MLDRALTQLADWLVRRARAVLVVSAILIAAGGAYGFTVFGKLSAGGFDDPTSQSSRAAALLQDRFGVNSPDLMLVVTATGGRTVDDPQVAAAGIALTSRLAAVAGLKDVGSYWSLGQAPALRSGDGSRALLVASTGATFARPSPAVLKLAGKVDKDFTGPQADGVITVAVGGFLAINQEVNKTITADLARAEAISVPLTGLALMVVFGSLVAAGLPLLIGMISIIGSFVSLAVIASFTDVSVFSINLTTGLGMGLGIDYALLVVSRFREELAAGREPGDAVRATVRTTGRTIIFSGLTVALGMSAMLVFPQFFLRSFAYAGVALVALAILAAVVVLPALLAVLGRQVDRFTVMRRSIRPVTAGPYSARHPAQRRHGPRQREGIFARMARIVMRRRAAVVAALGATALLLALGLPFLGARWGTVDERALPASAPSRQTQELIDTAFDGKEGLVSSIVLPTFAAADRPAAAQLAAYAAALSRVPRVARVESAAGVFAAGAAVAPASAALRQTYAPPDSGGTWLAVTPTSNGPNDQGEGLVKALRAVAAPAPALTGGPSATVYDAKAVLARKLPWAMGIIGVLTGILLFLFTGSVLLPAKALAMNVLSLSATFGAMVWIFQDGHLSGLLSFTPTGTLDMSVPVLMFCMSFGLSMDYEVFLLARIKEMRQRTGDDNEAVVAGLQGTGRIITAAAVLMSMVFRAFVTSRVTNIKLMGLGVAVAVLIDATVVRSVLVPAVMRLAGRWNWWAPPPLAALHRRIGLAEGPAELPAEAPAPAPAQPAPARVEVSL
ncbi:MAG: MMPL family transporter [Frankiaceae bacterium]|jgi:RND superfamily putative drug exporter|nr:MMPL family transporter [Frankiaceae bacterium]